jgi:putative CocE/NonD family hydrolase
MADLTYLLARAALRLPPSKVRGVARRDDLAVPMTDGTALLADHWVPDGNTRAPLLLVRSPYGRRASVGLLYGRALAHQGFQVVVQSCRGTAGSEGAFDRPFEAEADDGRDTVAWLRQQPFYPGRFATIGGSYLGYTQLALPVDARAEMFAAVLQIAPTSSRDVVLPDGNLAWHTSVSWSAAISRPQHGILRTALNGHRDGKRVRAAGMAVPLTDSYTRVTGKRLPHLDDWLSHPDAGDPWWQSADHSRQLEAIECPVLVQAGWWDAFLERGIEQFQHLRERGVPARLTIGPWAHSTFTLKGASEVMTEAVDFLRAAAELDAQEAAAAVHLRDTSNHRSMDGAAWPPCTSEPEPLFLTTGSLTAVPPTAETGSSTFVYDPADPTPSCGGIAVDLTGGPKDNRTLEAREDVLTFDAPVGTGQAYLGNPVAELWVSADVPCPELFVRLNVVDRKGRSTNLVDRLVRVPLDTPGATGTPTMVRVALPPVFRELQAGEHLRLLISGGAFPMFARATGTAEPAATATTHLRARISLHHDATRSSRLTLPRIAP